MFRLNLYPEAEQKRRAQLAKTGQTALIAFLSALTVVLTLFHAGTSLVFADRTRGLATQRARFEKEIETLKAASPSKSLPRLQERLATRTSRTLWSPKLVALAQSIPAPLLVDDISLRERGKGQSIPALLIHGTVVAGMSRDPVPTIVAFVNALKESPEFTEGLASVDLSSVSTEKETGATYFQIVCPLADVAAPAAAGQDNPELPSSRSTAKRP